MVKKIPLKVWLIAFFLAINFFLVKPYLLENKVPIPADILLGHYHPWRDKIWEDKVAGYPIKNFLLFDGIRQTLPWRHLVIEQWKEGKWPLWNPYILSGMPLLGNLQAAALYPVNLLFLFLPFLDAWTIYIFLQPLLAFSFAYFFLRTISVSWRAAFLGSICYGFSIVMLNHLEFGIDGHTALWLPLGLGAVNMIRENGRWRWCLVLMTSLVMTILGGYPPPAMYSLFVLSLYSFLKVKIISPKFFLVIISFVFAFLLTTVQILPFLELASKVIRLETDFYVLSSEAYFFPWQSLISLPFPDFFGHPSTNNYFGQFYVDNPSIGIIGLLFVAYAAFTFFKSKETFFWVVLTGTAFSLMLPTPLSELYKHLPSSLSMISPMKVIWLLSLSLSILAALGVDIAFEDLTKKRFWRFIFPIFFISEVVFWGWVSTFVVVDDKFRIVAQRNLILPTLLAGSTSFLLVLALLVPKIKKITFFVIMLLVSFELIREGVKYNPFVDKNLVFAQTEVLRLIQKGNSQWRTMITHPELFPVNSNVFYHIPMVDGYASIWDGRYGQLVRLASTPLPITELDTYPRVVFQTDYKSRIMDMLNVKYVLALEEKKSEKLAQVAKEGKTLVYENKEVLPKVFFVSSYKVTTGDLEAAKKVSESDLSSEVVLSEGLPFNWAEIGKGKVNLLRYSSDEVLAATENQNNGLLVLTDGYDQGWSVFIDGQKGKLLRANMSLRAVAIPKGNHQVKFIYLPESFKIGRVISSVALLALLSFSFWVLIRRRSFW